MTARELLDVAHGLIERHGPDMPLKVLMITADEAADLWGSNVDDMVEDGDLSEEAPSAASREDLMSIMTSLVDAPGRDRDREHYWESLRDDLCEHFTDFVKSRYGVPDEETSP